MKKLFLAASAALGIFCAPANAAQDQVLALVVTTCGTLATPYIAGKYGILTMDVNGKLCDSGSGGGGTQNVNLTQILGAAPSLTNPLWVSPATGAVFPVSQSGTWTVQPGNTPNTTPWLMAPAASASGGATPYHIASAASNNSTNVKSTPGTVYDLTLINTTTTPGDFRFYDSASAPTCSSATGVVNNLPVQSNAISPGIHLNYPGGKLFANGISFCYTGAVADNDNTNAATGVQINIDYK